MWNALKPTGKTIPKWASNFGDRTRKAMEIIKKFRDAQFRLAAADKQFIKAKRALPAAEKAELAAKIKRDAACVLDPAALVKTHTDAHNQTLKPTNAENKAAADCTQTSQSYSTWWQAMQSKRLPALQALAEAQLAWLQAEPISARLWNKGPKPSSLGPDQ